MNDKLQKLYDLYKQKGIINTTDFNTFAAANDAQRQKLYDLGVQKGLFNTTDFNTFNTAWSGGQQEPLKKKESTASASNLEKPTSASSSKRKDDFYKGGLGEEKQKPKEIERPSNVFIGYPGKEKNEYRVDNGTWQRRQPGKSEWTTITNEGSISSLNKQFNKTVKPMTALQKNELDKQVKRDADLEQRLNQVVTGNLVSQDELSARLSSDDAVAKTLKQSFPEFEFTARGGMSDRLDVVAPNGSTMELKLDNWTWDGDKEEANALKTFIRINSKDDTVKASQKIDSIQSQRKKEIDVATNKLAAENLLDRTQKFLNDPLAPVDSMALIKQKEEGEKLVKPISQKYQTPLKEAKEEYVKAKAEQFRDVYEMTRIDKSIDPKQAYASIRRDDRDIKIIGDYYNDVQKSAADLDKKQKEEQVRINTLAEKVKSGEMTMEEYDAIVKESNTLLAAQAKDVSANLKAVSTASKALDKSIGMNYIIEESRGSFGGGMAYKFVEGVTAIPRLLSFGDMSKEDQDELVKAITGGDTSTQYVESEKRGDLSKAMFSLAESLGVMASSAPLGALGSAARYAGFYGMSYYEMKDQLDEAKFYNKETDKVEKIPETDKVLLSAGYGVLSSVLENFGIDMALSKTAFGKNLANNIMKKAFLNLPKEATEAEIRAAINSSVNTVLGEIGVKAGIGASSEALTEASQSLAQVGIEEVYDEFKGKNFSKNKGLQDVLSNAAYEGYLGAIGGGVMSIAHSSPKALKVGFNSVYKKEELEALINATKIEGINSALVNNLKAELLTGNMSKEEANEIIQSFNKIQGSARSIPNNISSEGQAEALNLITERDKLNSEIEGKDPNLVVAQNERITEINNRLQEIAKENAVQEQSTNAIPVQSETGIGEEVAGGVPQSETQGITGEVVGEEAQGQQAKTKLTEEERQIAIDSFVERERESINNNDFLTEDEKQNSLTNLESDPISYAESQTKKSLNKNASDFLNQLNSAESAPNAETMAMIEVTEPTQVFEYTIETVPTELQGIEPASTAEITTGRGKNKKTTTRITYSGQQLIDAGIGKMAEQQAPAVEAAPITEASPTAEPVATEATIGDIEVTEVPVAQETISEVEQLNNILTAEDFSEVNLSDKKSNKVAAQITKAAKAISKVLPKVKFVVHSTPEAFVEATKNLDGRASEGGIYDHNTKTIHINLKNANSRTVAHEVFHALILSKVASDAEASRLTKSMIKAVIKSLKQADGGAEIISFLEDFESNYEDNIQNEEKLSELFAILADNYKKLPPATKNIIVRFLERMAKLVGIKPMTSNEITEFMNVLSAKVEAGEVISEKEIGKQKDGAVSETRKQIIGEKGAERLDAMESSTRRMSNLVMAKNMTDDGKSPLEIRVATGWELGADGKWRYETVDNIPYLKDTVKQVNEFLADNKDADSIEQKAYFFLPPELIKMYPELNDITIEFGRGNEKEGSYSPILKLIRVNVGVYPKNTVSVLLHEVQHVIQEIEGFDSGASMDRLMTKFVDREKGLSYRIKRLKGRGGNEALLEKAINDYREFVANFAIENNGKKILNAFNLYNRKSGEVEARNVQERMNMTEEERRKTLLSETAEVKKPQQIFSENMFQPRKQKTKKDVNKSEIKIYGEDFTDVFNKLGIPFEYLKNIKEKNIPDWLGGKNKKITELRNSLLESIDYRINLLKNDLDKQSRKLINSESDFEFRRSLINKKTDKISSLEKLRDSIKENLLSEKDIEISINEEEFSPRKQKIKTTIDEFDGETTVTLDGKKIGKMFYDRSQRAWVNAEFDKTSAKPYTSKWIYGDSLGDTKAEAINELIRRNSEAKVEAKVEEPKKVTQYTNDQIINEFLTELNGKENIQRSPIGKEFIYGDKAFLEFSRFDKETGAREISIQSIASMDKGQGIGKAVMKDITDTADELGITLTLDAKPFGDTGLSKKALINFYEKNGFVPDLEEAFGGEFETEEELIDYVIENEREALPMVREPKQKFAPRKQKNSVDRLVNEGKKNGKTDQEIRDEAKTAGFTAKEASNALAKYYAKEEGIFVRSGKTGVTTKLYEGAKKFKEQYLKSKGLLPKIGFFLKEKMEGEISKETNRAVKTARKFGKMFEDFNGDKDLLLDSFDKFLRGDTTVKLPRKFAAVANEMRNHIDTLSKMLINVGAIEGELADVIRGNIGSYLTRSYEIYDNKNWRDDVANETIVQAKNFLRSQKGMIAMATDEATKKNITVDEALDILVDNAIDDIFTKTEVTSLVSGQKLGSKDLSTLKEREDIPEQIRMLMGEYSDPAMNYARTVNNLIHLGARHKFLTDIKEAGLGKFFFEKNDAARPTGFNAQISAEGSKVMAPLNGLYTTPEIVQAFDQEFGEKEINKAMKLFYGAMGLVKWLKTIASVATHAKNVVSNLGFVMVNGHNITKLYDAFKVVKDDLKVMSDADIQKKIDEYIEAGIMRQGAGINEIRDMFKDANLDKYLERRLSNKKSKGTLGRIGQYLMSKGISTKIGLENAYQAEDDLFKIAAYENEVSRYANALYNKKPQNLTPEQKTEVSNIAAENVKNTYPTYSRIPEGIKKLRKIPLFVGSFISFQAESYRTAYNTIALAKDELSSDNKNIKLIGATRIAGATAYLTIKNALLSYFGMAFGTGLSGIVGALFDDDDEKEKEKDLREFLPPWAKNSDIIVKKNTDGTIEYIDFSASDPHGGINKALNAFFSGDDLLQSFTKSVLGVVEQFQGPDITVQLAMQIYNNADQYGNKIYNPEDTFDNNSKKIVDYIYDVIEPGTLTSTRKLIKEEDTKNVVIGELTGMKTRKIDVKQQFGFKLAEFDESFKDIKKVYNSEYNKTVRMMEDPKSTKKDIEEQKEKTKRAYEIANDLYNAKTQEMMKLINSANKLGVDYDAVMEEVKARKVISQYNLFEIQQGRPAVIEEKRY